MREQNGEKGISKITYVGSLFLQKKTRDKINIAVKNGHAQLTWQSVLDNPHYLNRIYNKKALNKRDEALALFEILNQVDLTKANERECWFVHLCENEYMREYVVNLLIGQIIKPLAHHQIDFKKKLQEVYENYFEEFVDHCAPLFPKIELTLKDSYINQKKSREIVHKYIKMMNWSNEESQEAPSDFEGASSSASLQRKMSSQSRPYNKIWQLVKAHPHYLNRIYNRVALLASQEQEINLLNILNTADLSNSDERKLWLTHISENEYLHEMVIAKMNSLDSSKTESAIFEFFDYEDKDKKALAKANFEKKLQTVLKKYPEDFVENCNELFPKLNTKFFETLIKKRPHVAVDIFKKYSHKIRHVEDLYDAAKNSIYLPLVYDCYINNRDKWSPLQDIDENENIKRKPPTFAQNESRFIDAKFLPTDEPDYENHFFTLPFDDNAIEDAENHPSEKGAEETYQLELKIKNIEWLYDYLKKRGCDCNLFKKLKSIDLENILRCGIHMEKNFYKALELILAGEKLFQGEAQKAKENNKNFKYTPIFDDIFLENIRKCGYEKHFETIFENDDHRMRYEVSISSQKIRAGSVADERASRAGSVSTENPPKEISEAVISLIGQKINRGDMLKFISDYFYANETNDYLADILKRYQNFLIKLYEDNFELNNNSEKINAYERGGLFPILANLSSMPKEFIENHIEFREREEKVKQENRGENKSFFSDINWLRLLLLVKVKSSKDRLGKFFKKYHDKFKECFKKYFKQEQRETLPPQIASIFDDSYLINLFSPAMDLDQLIQSIKNDKLNHQAYVYMVKNEELMNQLKNKLQLKNLQELHPLFMVWGIKTHGWTRSKGDSYYTKMKLMKSGIDNSDILLKYADLEILINRQVTKSLNIDNLKQISQLLKSIRNGNLEDIREDNFAQHQQIESPFKSLCKNIINSDVGKKYSDYYNYVKKFHHFFVRMFNDSKEEIKEVMEKSAFNQKIVLANFLGGEFKNSVIEDIKKGSILLMEDSKFDSNRLLELLILLQLKSKYNDIWVKNYENLNLTKYFDYWLIEFINSMEIGQAESCYDNIWEKELLNTIRPILNKKIKEKISQIIGTDNEDSLSQEIENVEPPKNKGKEKEKEPEKAEQKEEIEIEKSPGFGIGSS